MNDFPVCLNPVITFFSGSALTDRIWIFLLGITNVMIGIFVVNPPSFWDRQMAEGYFPVVSVSGDLFCTVPVSSLAHQSLFLIIPVPVLYTIILPAGV
jgi:hypothetical protein